MGHPSVRLRPDVVLGGALLAIGLLAEASPAAAESPQSLRFEDVTASSGVSSPRAGAYGPMWGDLDGDGWVDLLFTNHGAFSSLLRNEEGSGFVDRFETSGIRQRAWQYDEQADRHGAACGDYDGDGDVDVLIAHGAKRGVTLGVKYDELLHNLGGLRFDELAHWANVVNGEGRARLPTWVDYNHDGWVDLYVGNYETANVLYMSRGDGTFEDRSTSSGLALVRPMHPAWADWDRDGNPDVAVAPPLTMMHNRIARGFDDMTEAVGIPKRLAGMAFSLAWGDVDNDGDPDLFAVSRQRGHSLWINDDGLFRRRPGEEFPLSEGGVGQGAVWGDLDNDGWLDLVVVESTRLRLFHNVTGHLEEWALAATLDIVPGEGGDAAVADYDGDGVLDVAVAAAQSHHLLRGADAGGSWLEMRLVGLRGNRGAIGSEVAVETPAGRRVRQYFGDSGFYKAADCSPLHIGLGTAERVTVRVRWPRGRPSRYEGIPVPATLVVRQTALAVP